MKHLYLILAFLLPFCSFSQIDEMREKLDDELRRINENELTLRFINAESGEPVSDAAVNIDKLGSFTTDSQGRVVFEHPEKDGIYPLHFTKEKFIPLKTTFEISAGTIFFNRFSVSPEIDRENVRIVLDWGKTPPDLDAHLVKNGSYHISYRDMKVSEDGESNLDRDDMHSYGPETITIKDVDEQGSYVFYVKDYTNRNDDNSFALSKSKAHIRVYDNSGILNEWKISPNERGVIWKVFAMEQGQIKLLNRIENRE